MREPTEEDADEISTYFEVSCNKKLHDVTNVTSAMDREQFNYNNIQQ